MRAIMWEKSQFPIYHSREIGYILVLNEYVSKKKRPSGRFLLTIFLGKSKVSYK